MGLQVHPVIQQRILSLWMPADCHPIWTACQLYYVPGDTLYGWVGGAASIRRWLLLYATDKVQKGGVDDARDQNAIKIGMDLWDRPSLTPRFCSTFVVKIRHWTCMQSPDAEDATQDTKNEYLLNTE